MDFEKFKTLREKEKLLETSNFPFSHNVFYPFRDFSPIFVKFEIVVCNFFLKGEKISPSWTVDIKDQTTRSMQSDLDLHGPQKVRKSFFTVLGIKLSFFIVKIKISHLKSLVWSSIKLPPDLTLSQTSPGFYVSTVKVFRKLCGKRRNCSWRAISPFPIVFSTHSENFPPF